jgi:hypothetical protein
VSVTHARNLHQPTDAALRAAPILTKIIQGAVLKPIAQLSPFHSSMKMPYDWAVSPNARERLEAVFLNHTFRWLIPGGVLIFIILAER